ncbi:MAG TPA: hypothetical protein VKU00_01285, partial [Chthonomonadaceae bacterium]|nr:hypothetical protein [Chthonomonadaceae bacterium]
MSVQTPGLTGFRAAVPPDTIQRTLSAATRRIRALMLLHYGSRILCWTALACLLVMGLSKLHLFETPHPWVFAGILAAALLVAVILAFMRRLTELEVAKLTERRADLKERLSSAVEFQKQGIAPETPFYGEQLSDALHHAAGVNVRALYPVRIRWELPVGILVTLALFLAFYLPTLPMFWSKQKQQEMAEVKKRGMEIVLLAKDTAKNADQQKLDETKKAAQEARKIGEAMEKGQLNKKEALVALQKLDKKMEEAQKRLAGPPAKKSLEEAQKDFQKAMDKMQQQRDEAAKREAMKTQ